MATQTRNRTQYGYGQFRKRAYLRPESFERDSIETGARPDLAVTVGTVTGAFVGSLSSKAEQSIITQIDFTLDKQGCGKFKLVLSDLPDFDIPPFAIISFNIDNRSEPWYKGIVEESETYQAVVSADGEVKNRFVITGMGLRSQLDNVAVEKVYSFPQDAGAIFADMAQNYIAEQSVIGYKASKVNTTTGTATASDLDFSKGKVQRHLDSLARLSNSNYGVDGAGEIFFLEPDTDEQRVLTVGYDVPSLEVERNIKDIKNVIWVKNRAGQGSGGNGWALETTREDASSIAKYGRQKLEYTVPGSFGSGECILIADNLLATKKDPKLTAKAKNVPITSRNDFPTQGIYRFIMHNETADEVLQNCDDYTDWNTSLVSGDLSISNSDTVLAEGANSLKLEFQNASGDVITASAPEEINGSVLKLNFWTRSSIEGHLLNVGIGDSSWNEHKFEVDYVNADEWFKYTVDLASEGISTVNQVGFQIAANTASSGEIYVDDITLVVAGHRHYSLELESTDVSVSPEGLFMEMKFGTPKPNLDDYVAELFAQAENNQSSLEIR